MAFQEYHHYQPLFPSIWPVAANISHVTDLMDLGFAGFFFRKSIRIGRASYEAMGECFLKKSEMSGGKRDLERSRQTLSC